MTHHELTIQWFDYVRILASSCADTLEAEEPAVTVEAEYGDRCVEGTELTLAHHGPRAGNPAPCVAEVPARLGTQFTNAGATIGVSHVDLDTVGGILRLAEGDRPLTGSEEFWRVAAFVDVNGVHRLAEANASDEIVRQLHAWWAWSETNRVRVGPECVDVTEHVQQAGVAGGGRPLPEMKKASTRRY